MPSELRMLRGVLPAITSFIEVMILVVEAAFPF